YPAASLATNSTAPPRVVMEVIGACVAEEGMWVLSVTGWDLSGAGREVRVWVKTGGCDEMVAWLGVLKGCIVAGQALGE
ncbi:hypothetical protein HDU98_011855, partial [Podochytrium sp. JEL0797]